MNEWFKLVILEISQEAKPIVFNTKQLLNIYVISSQTDVSNELILSSDWQPSKAWRNVVHAVVVELSVNNTDFNLVHP